MAILFPAALLILTPIFDIVRAITDNMAWSQLGFWCAFLGVTLAIVTFLPSLIDWLALDRDQDAREWRARIPSLLLQGTGISAFIASVVLRLHAAGAISPAAFALADVGVTMLAVAVLVAGPRPQPVRLPYHPSSRPPRTV
jgi:uncharacterized membrane protein